MVRFGSTQTGLCAGHYDVQVTDVLAANQLPQLMLRKKFMSHNLITTTFLLFPPNPAKEEFVINYKMENYKDITLKITDIKGSVVFDSKQTSTSMSVKGLETGAYFVNLYNSEELWRFKRLLLRSKKCT